ncbi:MAG TPA: tRNA (adenosine(37)-N6)-threonylcarbamoyltransferase complex transferase subunit TsaD, partial [Pirellulales bacterium]
CVGLIVSGGHSNLYRCLGPLDFELLGATIDDAAGEAFDKVANLLGLPYPGGPAIEKSALSGDPQAYRFPRSLLDEPDRLEFSFSGLKTAVRYQVAKLRPAGSPPDAPLPAEVVADVAASFQEAAVDSLVGKTLAAMRVTGLKTVCVGGGVAANRRFREKMQAAITRVRGRVFLAPPALCTDNAVMGAIAVEHLLAGKPSSLDVDVSPGLIRSPRR